MKPEATRVAVITGGAGDLAQAVAKELRHGGWQVLAPGRLELDVTNAAQVKSWFGAQEQIDLLINNAGEIRDMPLLRMGELDFDAVTDCCLKGAFLCSQMALKSMVRQRAGHIIQMGSFSALSGPVGQANYAAAKAGLIGLTKSLAKEYGGRNVRVNAVLPGFLETQMTASVLGNPERRAAIVNDHALGRLNTLEEAARFIAFLDTMPHVSGQVFQLDSRVR